MLSAGCAHVGPSRPLGPMLGQVGPMLSYVGPILGPLGLCWAHVGLCRAYVGNVFNIAKMKFLAVEGPTTP